MHGMNKSRKQLDDELTNFLIDEALFKQSQYQMSIYYKYASDGSKLVLSYYVDGCVYWYTSKELVKWFVHTLGKMFHVNFLGYSHWFMSIRMSKRKDLCISLDQARYVKYSVEKYLDTATIKEYSKFHKTALPHDVLFTKKYYSTSDEQAEVLSR